MKELSEDMKFTISLKSLLGIAAVMVTLISMWFMVQSDINEAKKLPKIPAPEISRIEFTLKDEMVRDAIFQIQKDVEELKETLKEIKK